MKKIVASLALAAVASTSHATGGEIIAGMILGAIITQPRVVVQPPVVVYPQHPGVMYPQPIYQPRVLTPQPRVMTSHDPCYHYGQMVQTYDQFGHPMGFQVCR